jgi:choline-sulfatase
LFDLADDPEETHDLAASPAHRAVREGLERRLRERLDPEAVDRLAKDDQNRLVAAHGGRETVLDRPRFGATPVPVQAPAAA